MRKHFGSIPASVYTLFKSMAGGVSWGEPIEDTLMHLEWPFLAMFLLFISFSVFAMMNVCISFKMDPAQITMPGEIAAFDYIV